MAADQHVSETTWRRWLVGWAVVVVALPLLAAAARAVVRGWVPIGDDAYFTLRALDVGTRHHPLVGAWSSGSVDLDQLVNNLGPVQLDLLAPFVRIDPSWGTALGVVAVHLTAFGVALWHLWRLDGLVALVSGALPIAWLSWILGSEMLITPRQHQFLVPTYLCVLVAAWAAASGDRWAIVTFFGFGSLAVQTHLSYPILLACLSAPVVAGQIVIARRRGVERLRAPLAATGVMLAVLWVQPVIDQFAGFGNLGDVVTAPGGNEPAGWSSGWRIVASVLAGPDGYLRPGYGTWDPQADRAGWPASSLVAVVAAALVVGTIVAVRRGWGRRAAGLTVASVAVAAAVLDAAQIPRAAFGLTAFNYRWLWSTIAFGLIGLTIVVLRAGSARLGRWIVVVPLVAASLVAVANLPRAVEVVDANRYLEHQRLVTAVDDQLPDALRRRAVAGPVVIDLSGLYFAHPFSYSTGIAVRSAGLEYRYEGDIQERRFGAARVADGSEPWRLVLLHADAARAMADHPDTIVFVDGADPLAIVLEPNR